MGIDVTFYEFGKLPGSTKTPESSETGPYETVSAVLKDATSITAPTLTLTLPTWTTLPFHANYLYIEKFNRYYFIRDWVAVHNTVWECTCEIDTLATYREQIRASTQFVVRAERSFDTGIADGMAVSNSEVRTSREIVNNIFTGNTVVFSCGSGTSDFYVCNLPTFSSLLSYLLSDFYIDDAYGGQEWREIYPEARINFNPLQYIGSPRLLMVDIPYTPGQSIHIGRSEVPIPGIGRITTGEIISKYTTADVPMHPQSRTWGYVKNSPYSSIDVYFPPFGTVEIDPLVAQTSGALNFQVDIDPTSGMAELLIGAGAPQIILGTARANIAVPFPLSQTAVGGYSALNAISAMGQGISQLLNMDIGGALSTAGESITSYFGSNVPKHYSSGGDGCALGYNLPISINGRFSLVKPPPAHFAGYMLYQQMALDNLWGGFVRCANAEIGTAGTLEEARKICSLLERGVYLE